jgi:nitrate/nitrite transport system ATP-binding protein
MTAHAPGRASDYVRLDGVRISFATRDRRQTVVDDFTLTMSRGEVVCLIGHSGCGKTTLLNAVAGLLAPDAGAIVCAGLPITGPGPDRGMVFQNHALLPWMTCFENVHLGVAHIFGRAESRRALAERTRRALALVHLADAAGKYPAEISGGMKQRVGIARALAIEPKMLLLDEPFGALDALTRAHLQDELARIIGETGTTALMVTHDVDEAVLLADRIVMMGKAGEKGGAGDHTGSMGGIVTVPLPRPRDRLALSRDPVFVQCRSQVLEFLYRRPAS